MKRVGIAVGGCLLHEWGNGQVDEEWVRIREEARSLFEQAGVLSPFHLGVRSDTAIEEALEGLRLVRERERGIWALAQSSHYGNSSDASPMASCRYIWRVPENVRTECLPRLVDWAERTFDLDRSIPTPRELCWTVYRKQAA